MLRKSRPMNGGGLYLIFASLMAGHILSFNGSCSSTSLLHTWLESIQTVFREVHTFRRLMLNMYLTVYKEITAVD